jgi:hypothetical protein
MALNLHASCFNFVPMLYFFKIEHGLILQMYLRQHQHWFYVKIQVNTLWRLGF